MKPFLDALREAPLLWDGAMGSLLYERGVFLTRCFDELNLSQPELIAPAPTSSRPILSGRTASRWPSTATPSR